jgi:pimeloyl-ACP methyl ester carboxylesterase
MELAYQLWKSNPDLTGQTSHVHERIVLLHGMGGTGKLWRPVAANLEDQFEVLAPDQRGHGGSRALPSDAPYTPLDYGQDLVETLGITEFHPAWVVGHSMGVRTACALAHLAPKWVQGLVCVDLGLAGPAGGGLGLNLALFLKTLPEHFPTREDARRFMALHCPDPSIAQYLMAVSESDTQGGISFPFNHAALIRTIEAVSKPRPKSKEFTLRPWLEEFGERNLPVLILRGEKSLVWSAPEFREERESFARFPSMIFEEIPGASHGLPFEQRTVFVSRVKEFIKRR